MLENKPANNLVAKRMLDFCSAATPWTRQLWRLGSVLEINELLEAIDASQAGALSDASVKYLSQSLTNRVKRDHGLGIISRQRQMAGYLNRPLVTGGHDRNALQILLDETREKYLSNWASAVAANSNIPSEVIARAVTSHLLDEGYSTTAIHKWLTYQIKYSPIIMTLPELIEEAQGLVSRPKVEHQLLVPLKACPPLPDPRDESWLSASEASDWLSYWYPGLQHPRHTGGLLLKFCARDIYSALVEAYEWTDRISSRFRVGARKRLEFLPKLYLLGEESPMPYLSSPRRVEVLSLEKTSEVFRLQLSPQIDASLELMEALDRGTRTTAVAGSWAALESLLVGPGDTMKVAAATRVSRIVACSYVRSEFASLANAYASSGNDDLSARLRSLPESGDQALALERAMRSGEVVNFPRTRHAAAAHRMQELIANPGAILPKIVGQLEDSFRRLYRQRNLIVHAGLTSSVALRGTLRTVAPLVGAGMDRIVHANAAQSLDPLTVAAIAQINLEKAAHDSRQDLVRLLG